MKNSILFILILFGGLINLAAQDKGKHENFKAYKIAYITQQLDLSPDEAEKFWPLYNEFGKKFYELKVIRGRDIKRKIQESGGIDTLNEIEANEYVTILLDTEKEIVKLKMKYYDQLKNVLSTNKVLQLYNAENAFNRRLLSEFRRNKTNRPNN